MADTLHQDAMTHDRPETSVETGVKVHFSTLDNGMDVVVLPTRPSPIVTHMVWYRNGATDDLPGKSGTAHFLEHLMFKGTKKYPAGQFTDFVSGQGGKFNAFTSWSFTSYYQRLPGEFLAQCMDYEADRMVNLDLQEDVIATERDVVLSERGMQVESNPEAVLAEKLQAAVFGDHPCSRPIIGWRHEIEKLDHNDAMAYYRRFYTPSNAILVVAGDVDPDNVREMAQNSYGRIAKSEQAPERPQNRGYPQNLVVKDHQRIKHASSGVGQPILHRVTAVPAPRLCEPKQTEAYYLLAYLLGGDETSLLYKKLIVETAKATEVSVTYYGSNFVDQTRFDFVLKPAQGVSVETLEQALEKFLSELAQSGFSERDLKRVKTQFTASLIFSQDNQETLAHEYGTALCAGLSVERLGSRRSAIEAVTLDDLKQTLMQLLSLNGVSAYLVASK